MTVPPPTPKSPLNAPAAVPIASSRTILGDMRAILRAVPAPPAETLAESLRPLTEAPAQAGIFCDVDGTLAPIVQRPESAHVPEETSRLIARLASRFRCVACISGRSAAEAKRLVGVGGIVYAGAHGAEILEAGASRATLPAAVASETDRVQRFARRQHAVDLRMLRVRMEEKGPIVAFHWRGVPDERAAHRRLREVAAEAEAAGLGTHWGRKVLELRPPVPGIDKGRALRELVARFDLHRALFGGDDVTDLDAFEALDELEDAGVLEGAVRVGVRSEEGPVEILRRADVVVEGVAGFSEVLTALAEA